MFQMVYERLQHQQSMAVTPVSFCQFMFNHSSVITLDKFYSVSTEDGALRVIVKHAVCFLNAWFHIH